ncbi:MAG: hypothetical protein ACREAX_04125 [Candidatus Nitrosotenuis sp.]
MKANLILALFAGILASGFSSVFAHTTITVDPYEIEVGWRDEPPLVSQQNAIVFAFTTDEGDGVTSGVTNAFRDLQATIKSGSITKTLDILSDAKPGHYYAKIIPTKVGALTVELKGSINGVEINEEIGIEDTENINVLAFPPADVSGLPDLAQLKNAMSSLQRDVADLKSKDDGTGNVVQSSSYDLALFALALGAAGVILAVVAMIKRK